MFISCHGTYTAILIVKHIECLCALVVCKTSDISETGDVVIATHTPLDTGLKFCTPPSAARCENLMLMKRYDTLKIDCCIPILADSNSLLHINRFEQPTRLCDAPM